MKLYRGLKDMGVIRDIFLYRCRYLYTFLPKEKENVKSSIVIPRMVLKKK